MDSAGKHSFLDIKALNDTCWKDHKREITIDELVAAHPAGSAIPDCKVFQSEYDNLQIVNPNKEKFKDTTFNKNYYEMLRMYSNELEKEATSLFVIGFSMADEHIREITIRAVKSNPTLFVFICSFQENGKDIVANLSKDGFDINKHRNVRIIHLEKDFDLKKINELLFAQVVRKIKEPEGVK